MEEWFVLIVDRGRELQDALYRRAECLPIKGQGAQILLAELLKMKSVTVNPVLLSNASSTNPLDLIYNLKTDTKADALILGDENFEILRFNHERNDGIVQLSKYRDSNFEKERQRYCDGLGPIDTLSRSEVDEIIIRSIRFSKWLQFYDRYITIGENTSGYLKGVKYILSLWRDHGFFASQQGMGKVIIFTGTEHMREDEEEHVKEGKLARRQENYRKVKRELMEWLKTEAPQWWKLKICVKDDPDHIFHARYLETQHAIIRIDRGFDLFKQNGEFRRNFFTLNMAEGSHLRECRDLPDATV